MRAVFPVALAAWCIPALLFTDLRAEEKILLQETFASEPPANWATTGGTIGTESVTGLNGHALVYSREKTGGYDKAHVAYVSFPPAALTEAGDTLTLSFLLKGISYGTNIANKVTFGFFNSQGDRGYIGLLRADARTGFTGSPAQFRSLDAGPSFNVKGYTGTVIPATVSNGTPFYLNGSAEGSTGNIGDVIQITFSITREKNNDLTLNQTVTNTATSDSFTSTAVISAADVITDTFDVLTIGHSRVDAKLAVDDVRVVLTKGDDRK
jgi:hypothetical protein